MRKLNFKIKKSRIFASVLVCNLETIKIKLSFKIKNYIFEIMKIFLSKFNLLCVFLCFFVSSHGQTKEKKELNDQELVFWNTFTLGVNYQRTNFKKADSLCQPLLDKAALLNDSARLFAYFYDLEIDRIRGRMSSFKQKTNVFSIELKKIHGTEVKIFMLQALAYRSLDDRNFSAAVYFLRNAIHEGRRRADKLSNAESYRLLALSKMHLNQRDSAILFVEEAISLSRRNENREQLAICFNSQGEIYSFFGQSEIGVAKRLIALQLVVIDNNPRLISQFNNELGLTQLEIGNTNDAIGYFTKSIETAKQVKDFLTLAKAYLNLGICQSIDGANFNAQINYQKSIQLYQQEGDLLGLGIAHRVIGVSFRKMLEFKKSEENLFKSMKYLENKLRIDLQTETLLELGILKTLQGYALQSISYLKKGLDNSLLYKQPELQNKIYQALSSSYGKQNKFKEAFYYLERYTSFSDSSKNILGKTKIAELSELYKVEQRERLIAEQGASLSKQEKEAQLTKVQIENINLRNNFMTYFVMGLIVIAILGSFLVKNRINQTKLKQQQKEAEMNQTLLRTQMNPHFIFNAMSVIQSYIYENDVKNSTKFLVNFSRLMRLILENSPKEYIPISTEQEILEKYLQTQKLRFEDRFEFHIYVEDQLLDDEAVIPPMITQPFIENAIEHGQLHTIEGGFINVNFSKEGNYLIIKIEDNGIGRKGASQNKKSREHKSMAMKITSDRIANLNEKYKSNGFMELEDFDKEKETGTLVRISLPYQQLTNEQIEKQP
jgi:tetratricopeptide (TPR) repeat protein